MWPDFTPDLVKRPFPKGSLLEGTEAALWQSLGRMPAARFETNRGKQLVLRQALADLGLDWVATNTTPFRMAVGNLFDAAAAQQHRHHRSHNSNNIDSSTHTNKRRKRIHDMHFDIQIHDEPVRELSNLLQGPLLTDSPHELEHEHNKTQAKAIIKRGQQQQQQQSSCCSCFSTEQRRAVRRQLDAQGACVVRQAVPCHIVRSFARDLMAEQRLKSKAAKKAAKLAETTGNGVAGTPPSVYRDLPLPPTAAAAGGSWRRELQDVLWDLLLGTGSGNDDDETLLNNNSNNAKQQPPPRKDILLLYGHGAENWAHQDNNREIVPVQAVLMLSDPQQDFEGGEFYVARREQVTTTTTTTATASGNDNSDDDGDATNNSNNSNIRIRRTVASLENAGDLVLFQAGRETGWWHGMLPVKRRRRRRRRQPPQQQPPSASKDHPDDKGGNDDDDDDDYIRKAVGMLQPT